MGELDSDGRVGVLATTEGEPKTLAVLNVTI